MCLKNNLALCYVWKYLDYVSFHHQYNWDITEILFCRESFDFELT
jgi:hypothetical protein